MENRFADLLTRYRARKHGLTQARLAAIVGYDPAVITRMCRGQTDLTGPGGRDRVTRLIHALNDVGAIGSVEEADALLASAGMPPLFDGRPDEAGLIKQLRTRADAHPSPQVSTTIIQRDLPDPVTSFIGREREMADVRRLFTATRLLTLTGPGGVGKTRLALELGRDLRNDFVGGFGWVTLASLTDPSLVVQAAANAFHVYRPGRGALLDVLTEQLQGKRTLLVLDNCEHLVGACAELVEHLMGQCPGLSILATSREALLVPGEQTFRLPPLSMPGPVPVAGTRIVVDHLLSYGAVQLFVERVKTTCADFVLTPENAPAVAQLCKRLDGLPLALELAAAVAPALSVEQIAMRLDDRLSLLNGGYRNATPRHQALSRVIDWSYDLLSPAEQAGLARLSVFSGGWAPEAAEKVVANSTHDSSPSDVLHLLRQLVNKSLVVAEHDGGRTRYRLLETIREYAWGRLHKQGETDALRDRHLDYYVGFAERASAHVFGVDHSTWMKQLDAEQDNVREALAWGLTKAREGGSAEAVLRLTIAMWMFWNLRNHAEEAGRWLREALAQTSAAEQSVLRAKACYIASRDGVHGDDPARVEALTSMCHLSLAECRERNQAVGVAYSLLALVGLPQQGRCLCDDVETAKAYAVESLRLFEFLGEARGIADARTQLARVQWQHGCDDQLVPLLEGNCILFRQTGDRWNLCQALAQLAWVAQAPGDDARINEITHELIALVEETGEKQVLRSVFGELGGMAQLRGRHAEARAYLSQSLEIALELDDRDGLYGGLMTMCNFDHPRALDITQEYLEGKQQAGDKYGIACALYYLGIVLQDGGAFDYTQSQAILEQSLTLWRELRVMCAPHGGVARVLINLGQAIRFQGDDKWATVCYAEAIRLARAENAMHILRPALLFHSYAMLALGRLDEALADDREIIRLCRDPAGRPVWVAQALAAISEVIWRRGQVGLSARLAGAATTQSEAIHTGPHNLRVDYEHFVNVAHQRSDDPVFAFAWEEGRKMSIDQAAELALA